MKGFEGLRVGLVGPVPPPSGGMANQTHQLAELLRGSGASVRLVPSNAPYRPALVARLPAVRAAFRLIPYLGALWRTAGHSDVFHVMANSGWSWHLFAAPAIWIARARRVPVVVNYRGGEAADFLARSQSIVRWSMKRATKLLVPSAFLEAVFARCGMPAEVLPNIIDLDRFHPAARNAEPAGHIVVSRNLEPIYDNETALRAFRLVLDRRPNTRLTIAGSGPEEARLHSVAAALNLGDRVRFAGRLDRDAMALLYREADVSLNASLADNMPNSLLESLASGVPVVSTNVGGIPFLVRDGETALLVAPRDAEAMAAAVVRLLEDESLRGRLSKAGAGAIQRFAWPHVAPVLAEVYRRAMAPARRQSLGASAVRPQSEPAALAARTDPRVFSGATLDSSGAGPGMYTAVVSSIIFPLHERLKRHASVAVRRRMERTQWWSAEQLASANVERLRALLEQAAIHVPYYRDLFRARGFNPATVRTLSDLQYIPFLTKAIVRANLQALKHDHARGLARFNTGGSSGEPLIFLIGKERVSHDVAAKWRATRWWGVDIGDPEIVVWGSPIELAAQDRLRHLRDRLLRTELLPAFEMSDRKLDGFIAAIRRRRPKMLFGYPSALSYIARHAEKRAIAMDDLGVEVAFVTSERLYDDQRQTIGRIFNCKVANGYGGRDAGFIAHECPSGGMHITADDIIVELIGRDGQPMPAGTPGEIVVTHLATRDFPFIRYKTGDIATLDTVPCACGRGLPILKEIQGRTTDFVVASDGTVMHGLALVYIVRDLPGVESFKIVQESLQRTTVLLVVHDSFDRGLCNGIVSGVRRRLGPAVEVNVELVAQIAPEKSGKFRYVVSHVAEAH